MWQTSMMLRPTLEGPTASRSGQPLASRVAVWAKHALLIASVLLTLEALWPSVATAVSSPEAQPDFSVIDRFVRSEMDAIGLPGVALGIVQGDRVVHMRGFGEADSSGGEVTPQTPFVMGSVAKTFTALAIMQLVEAGEVDLESPVRRYLPWFRVADPEASERITVRHLLTHTSGLSQYLPGDAYITQEDLSDDALENAVRDLKGVELTQPVGETAKYSNMGYSILGLIVQTVAGEPFEQYVQERILDPLEMGNSYASVAEARQHGLATGYQFWFGRPHSTSAKLGTVDAANRALAPAGLITSSAEDMTHFLIAQLNGGRYRDTRVLSPASVAEMHRPAVDLPSGDLGTLGWVAGKAETNGIPTVSKGGDNPDFHANVILDPSERWGVVLLTNGNNLLHAVRINSIAPGVLSLLVGREPPPAPSLLQEPQMQGLLLVLAVAVLQLAGMARSIVLLRRWRTHPALRPRGVVRIAMRVLAPAALNFAWVWWGILPATGGGLSASSVSFLMLYDVGWAAFVSGAVALVWGVVLRPALVLLVLRLPGTKPPGSPDRAQIPQDVVHA
jgi:CubicO group peptidase (beta-lactamase class C family)